MKLSITIINLNSKGAINDTAAFIETRKIMLQNILSFIAYSVFHHVHSMFPKMIFRRCELMLLLSIPVL
jgi:hypothetical protein